jgi:hypothetical protein
LQKTADLKNHPNQLRRGRAGKRHILALYSEWRISRWNFPGRVMIIGANLAETLAPEAGKFFIGFAGEM